MTGTGGRNDPDGDLACIPILDILGGFQVTHRISDLRQVLDDAGAVMLVPVGDQHVLAVCLLDKILQFQELLIVDGDQLSILRIEASVRHLQKFS